jgi:hypothetical protein
MAYYVFLEAGFLATGPQHGYIPPTTEHPGPNHPHSRSCMLIGTGSQVRRRSERARWLHLSTPANSATDLAGGQAKGTMQMNRTCTFQSLILF